MFTNETFMAILKVMPGFLDIIIRYCYDLAMHALSVFRAAL